MQQKTTPISSLSYLRIVATICVVLLHVCSTLIQNPDLFLLRDREKVFFSAIYKGLEWAVPVFLMISGALLLNPAKQITIRDSLFRYVQRIILALLIFGIPFGMMIELSETHRLSFSMIPGALVRVITNRSFSHLWFLYMLAGIYLLLPAIRAVIDHSSESMLKYLLAILFVFNLLLPFLSSVTGMDIAFSLPITSCYMFYLLMGFHIFWHKPKWSENLPVMIAILALYAIVIITACTFWPDIVEPLAATSSPLTAAAAIGIFCVFQRIKGSVSKKIWMIDRLTFGVYLVHPVFIHLLYRVIGITPAGDLFPLKTVGIALIATIISFAVSWVLSRVPFIGKYVL